MNEVFRSKVVRESPLDEPLYSSVLDREPEWVAASTSVPVSRRRSRMPVAAAFVLVGAAFASGLAVGSGLALTTRTQPHPRRPAVWMFPDPAIGFPSPAESTRDARKREPESRLRGESR